MTLKLAVSRSRMALIFFSGVRWLACRSSIIHPTSARPVVTFPAAELLAQGCYAALPRVGFEPTTCWLQVQRSTRCATTPTLLVYYYIHSYIRVFLYGAYKFARVTMRFGRQTSKFSEIVWKFVESRKRSVKYNWKLTKLKGICWRWTFW